jgi:hypothetical protein
MNDLPQPVAEVLDVLAAMPGAVAVVLGGSRALGSVDAGSDWDLGLYYRGALDLTALEERAVVYPPGSFGRVMNGGAWLWCGGEKVDVLLRDLDVVEHWTRRAEDGDFEVDALLGYLAGVPTYSLCAERASCRLLRGELPAAAAFPPRLVAAAPPRWRFCRAFSLDYARMHARRGNAVGAAGQVAKAVVEEAHAVVCERGRWVLNEKRLLEAAGLDGLHALFARVPSEPADLVGWVDAAARELGGPGGEATAFLDGLRAGADWQRLVDQPGTSRHSPVDRPGGRTRE